MTNKVRIGVGVDGAHQAAAELDALKNKFTALSGAKFGAAIGAGAAVATAGLHLLNEVGGEVVNWVGESIEAAGRLNETLEKSDVVFGDAAEGVAKFGKDAAESMGLSEEAAVSAAASIGNLLLSTGTAPAKIAPMSEALVSLAADLASFNNIDIGSALSKIQSGIVGQERPLRELGVAISAASVDAKALELGFTKVNGVFTEGQKVQARYALIFEQTKTAQGDFARTAGSMVNQQRILQAELANTSEEFGNDLIPVVIAAQKEFIHFFDILHGYPKQQATIAEGIAKNIADGNVKGLQDAQAVLRDATDKFKHPEMIFNPSAFNSLMEDLKNVDDALADTSTQWKASNTDMTNSAWDAIHGISHALDAGVTAIRDFRDEYRDASGEIIRRSGRIRDALVKDAAIVRGDVFDETEIRAALHDQRMALMALEAEKRGKQTREEARKTSDAIVQNLDDEGQSLEDLASQGKLTQHDVDLFTKHAKRNFADLSEDGKQQIQTLISKYQALVHMPNVSKTFTISEVVKADKGSAQDTHGPGRGQLKARGGPVIKGEIYTVGEEGPETFVPSTSGVIIPNGGGGTPAMAGAGHTFNITVNAGIASGLTAGSARALASELGPALYADMQRRGLLPRAGILRG